MNNPLYFIFCVLLSAITFAGWALGYVMASTYRMDQGLGGPENQRPSQGSV